MHAEKLNFANSEHLKKMKENQSTQKLIHRTIRNSSVILEKKSWRFMDAAGT